MFRRGIVLLAIAHLLLIGADAMFAQQDSKAMLSEIYANEMQNYQEWTIIPGSDARMPGKGAHGKFITTYVNDTGLKAIEEGAEELPEGTILVKDNFHNADDEKPWSAVMMKKIDGRWFFGVFFPPYQTKMAGFPDADTPAEQACLKCHINAPNDQVFLWQK